jgi:hypothetical protein
MEEKLYFDQAERIIEEMRELNLLLKKILESHNEEQQKTIF